MHTHIMTLSVFPSSASIKVCIHLFFTLCGQLAASFSKDGEEGFLQMVSTSFFVTLHRTHTHTHQISQGNTNCECDYMNIHRCRSLIGVKLRSFYIVSQTDHTVLYCHCVYFRVVVQYLHNIAVKCTIQNGWKSGRYFIETV